MEYALHEHMQNEMASPSQRSTMKTTGIKHTETNFGYMT